MVRVVVKSMSKSCIVVRWRALYFGMGAIAISEVVGCSAFFKKKLNHYNPRINRNLMVVEFLKLVQKSGSYSNF